jgi:hypothetical protein
MAAEPEPPHPIGQLTSSEMRDYRRELEHAINRISRDAPVQADLRSKLEAVLAEEDSRAKAASRRT